MKHWLVVAFKQKVNHDTKSSAAYTKKGRLTVLHFDHVSHAKEETTIKKICAWCRFWFLSGRGCPPCRRRALVEGGEGYNWGHLGSTEHV